MNLLPMPKSGDFVKILKLPNIHFNPDLIGALAKIVWVNYSTYACGLQVGSWEMQFPVDLSFITLDIPHPTFRWYSILDAEDEATRQHLGKFGFFGNSLHDARRREISGYLDSIISGRTPFTYVRRGDSDAYALFAVREDI